MKDRRIWVIIGCILVVGIAITSYTSSVVKAPQENGIQVLSENMGETDAEVSEKAIPEIEEKEKTTDTQAVSQTDAQGKSETVLKKERGLPEQTERESQGQTEGELQTQAEEENQSPIPIISDVQSVEQETEKAAVIADGREQESYTERLKNLDSQIQKMREQETDSNVYSAKTSAETELKMWDGELSVVYNALLEALPQEEALSLANEEKDWLKKRESDAVDSSGKTANGLSYASSMVNQTRDRAYELAKRCDELAKKDEREDGSQ